MTFLAVLRSGTFGSLVTDAPCANVSSTGDAKYPVTPVAAILKNTLRSMIVPIGTSIIEDEIHLIQQYPLEVFGGYARALLLEHRRQQRHLVTGRRPRERVQKQLANDRRHICVLRKKGLNPR